MQAQPPTRVLEGATCGANDAAAPAPDSSAGATGLLGREIAGFRLVGVLGYGGMGAVFEAEQQHPRRRVALKLLAASRSSPELLRRFQHEVQLLARLQHPYIAQIYQAGSFDAGDGPQPYFVLEYVDGLPLVEHVQRHDLALDQMLVLIVRLCEAVQHAHQRGIIHRDLKPANILVQPEVDGPGCPKVLDFGIARAVDELPGEDATLRTRVGQLVGTLAYMSPEQARGAIDAIDTRSDVYALGVIAYELLAGRLPWEPASLPLHEAVRQLCETDPPPVSRFLPAARGDLERVVAKALAKDPAQRYGSARELAADIEAVLQHRPISARPARLGYRLQRFARRNTALFAGLSALLLSLLVGLVASTMLYLRAEHHRQAERERAEQLEQVARVLEARLAGVAVAQMGMQLRQGLDERFAQAAQRLRIRPAELQALKPVLQALMTDADFSGLALEALDAQLLEPTRLAIERELAAQPLVQARLLLTLGRSYRDLGRTVAAEAALRQALALRVSQLGAEHAASIEILAELVGVLERLGAYEEAERLAHQVFQYQRAQWGPRHPLTLRSRHALGGLLIAQGRLQEAIMLLEPVLAQMRDVLGPQHRDTLNTMNSLGMALVAIGDYAAAEALLIEALDRFRALGERETSTLRALNNLGFLRDLQGQPAAAEALYREALEGWREVYGDEHPETLTAMNNLAFALSDLGQHEEAAALWRLSMEGRRRVLGDRHPDTLGSMSTYGVMLRESGVLEEAATIAALVVDNARAVLPEGHWHTGVFLGHLGLALLELGRLDEAEAALRESESLIRAALGEGHPRHDDAVERLERLARAYESSEEH